MVIGQVYLYEWIYDSRCVVALDPILSTPAMDSSDFWPSPVIHNALLQMLNLANVAPQCSVAGCEYLVSYHMSGLARKSFCTYLR